MRNLRWNPRALARGHNPYRDAALVNAGLGAVVIVVAVATGGSVVRAVVAVLIAWSLGTAYSWWRVRQRAGRDAD